MSTTPIPPAAAPDVFTVAHLSDPHLTTLVGVTPRSLLNKRILGYLSWLRRRRFVHDRRVLDDVVTDVDRVRPDHVAVTGDLTHIGLPQECAEAAVWLETLGAPSDVSVVPGNHDRYVDADWQTTVGRWRDYLRGDVPTDLSYPMLRQFDGIALIGLNSAVASAPFFATGRVGKQQRERLAEMLTALGEQSVFRLVALHHSPLPRGHAWRKRLTDAADVLAVLEEHGAELVIHGHGHQERLDVVPTESGAMLVIAAPSASYRKSGRAGWNRYDISNAKDATAGRWRVRVETRRWHEERGIERGDVSEYSVGPTSDA